VEGNQLRDGNRRRLFLDHFSGGIELGYGCQFNRIVKNLILDAAPYGIVINDGDRGLSSDNVIVDNTIIRPWYHGILDRGTRRDMLQGNVILESSRGDPGRYSGIHIESAGQSGVSEFIRVRENCIAGKSPHKLAVEITGGPFPPAQADVSRNILQPGSLGSVADGGGKARVLENVEVEDLEAFQTRCPRVELAEQARDR